MTGPAPAHPARQRASTRAAEPAERWELRTDVQCGPDQEREGAGITFTPRGGQPFSYTFVRAS